MSTMSPTRLDKHLVSLTAPASFVAEQYQGLRLKLDQLRQTRDVRVIAITSPGVGDGKTVTSINLAGALARTSDARVLLVDADLRRSAVAAHLGITNGDAPGLAEVVANPQTRLQDVVWTIEPFNFSAVTAGSTGAPVHAILRSPRLEQVLHEARERYDYVVLDTPPLVPVFDSALLARMVDGLLIVVAAHRTPRKLCEEALNLLDPSKVLGIVFNGDKKPLFGYYRSYSQYFLGASNRTREASVGGTSTL